MDADGRPDIFDFLPPQAAGQNLYGADAFASMGGISAYDAASAIQGWQQQRQQAADESMWVPEPLDLRVPEDQFVDLPTYQQLMPNLSSAEAYDEYLNVALPQQLQDMGMSPEDRQATLQNFRTQVPRPGEPPGIAGELGNVAMSGWDIAAQDVKGLAQRFLPDWLVEGIEGTGKALGMPSLEDVSKQRQQDMSPAMKAALAKEWVTEDAQGEHHVGPAFGDWRSYAGGLLQSLPEAGVGIAGGMLAAELAPVLGLGALGTKAATYLGGGLTEGLLAGEQSGREVTDYIMKLPEETLQKSQAYQTLLQTMTPADARKKLASDADTQAFLMSTAGTAAFGGAGDLVLRQVIKGEVKGLGKRVVKGAVSESLGEEVPQSYLQQVSQNLAEQQADPSVPTTRGALNQAVGGGVLGALQGGAQTAVFGRNPLKPTPDVAATPDTPEADPLAGSPIGPGIDPNIAQENMAAFRTRQAAAAAQAQQESAAALEGLGTPEELRAETRQRVANGEIRDLLREQDVPLNDTVYAKELDGIAEAADPVAAIDEAITSLQGRTGKNVPAIAEGLEIIRDHLAADTQVAQTKEALQRSQEALARLSAAPQDVIRSTVNIVSGKQRRATRDAWIEHFNRIGAIYETERAAAELRIMEAERAETMDRQARQQAIVGAATAEGGGGAPARTIYAPADMTEAASRIDDALGALPKGKQTAVRQRANQILKETVDAANQRADQRRNAGYPRTQSGAPGRPDLRGGSAAGGGRAAGYGAGARAGRLGPRQRAAVGRAGTVSGTATGTGSTLADRLIAQVEAGGDPRVLGLLVLADETTRQIIAETPVAAPVSAPTPVVAPTPPAPTLKRATTPLPSGLTQFVSQQPVEQSRAQPTQAPATQAVPAAAPQPARPTLKRGRPAVTPLEPAPRGSIGANLLHVANRIQEFRRRRGEAPEAGSAGVVRPRSIAEGLAPLRGQPVERRGRTGPVRRSDQNAPRVPRRLKRTAADTAVLTQKQDLVDSLVAKYGFPRATAWGLVDAQGTTDSAIVNKAAEQLTAKKDVVDALVDTHGIPRDEAWKLVEADSNELWDAPQTVNDEDLQNVGAAGEGVSPELQSAITNEGVDAALEHIAQTTQDPLQQAVATRLQEVGVNASIEMGELPGRVKGEYVPRTNSITIDPVKGDVPTVLHEVTHAGTQATLRNPQTPEERAAAARMNELYKYAKDHPKSKGKQGLRGFHSVEEFVAEAFGNPAFQEHLRDIPLPGKSAFSVLSAFKKFVLDLLGVSSVLSETLMAGEDLLSSRVFSLSASLANEASAEKVRNIGEDMAGRPKDSIVGVDPLTGERKAIAYKEKGKGTYNYYEATNTEPKGIKGTNQSGMTRQEVEKRLADEGLTFIRPQAESGTTTEPPKATQTSLPGWDGDALKILAFQEDDGSWNVYESDTDNVTTDPNATITSVPSKASVQALLNSRGYKTAAPSPKARVATGGGGGSNTANQTGPATLTPGGPAKDLTLPKTNRLRVEQQNRYQALSTLQKALIRYADAYNIDLPHWALIDVHATLRNTRAAQRIEAFTKKHVMPLEAMSRRIMNKYGKSDTQLEGDQMALHYSERAAHKLAKLNPNVDWTTGTGKAAVDKLNQQKTVADRQIADLQRNEPAYYADLLKLADRTRVMTHETLDLAVAYGLKRAKDVADMKAAYKYYMPIQTGLTTAGKTATGSTAAGTSPFVRMQQQFHQTILRGEQNAMRHRVYRLVQELGLNIVDENGNTVIQVGMTPGKIGTNPSDFTLDYIDDSPNPIQPNSVAVFINGERHYMRINNDENLFDALKQFSGGEKDTARTFLMHMMAKLNHLSAMGKTAMNPGFAIFNFTRDTGATMVLLKPKYSRAKFVQNLGSSDLWGSSFYSAFAKPFGGDPKGIFKQVKEAGGLITQQSFIGMDPLTAQVEGSLSTNQIKQGLRYAKKGVKGAAEFMMAASTAMESATRLAIYNTVYEVEYDERIAKGMSPVQAKEEATDIAAYEAKTTTVNFERRGLKPIAPWFLFGNAKVQGIATFYDKLVADKQRWKSMSPGQKAKEMLLMQNGVAAAVGLVSLGLMAAALGYKYSDKDKDGTSKYGKIPQNKRDSMFIIKEGWAGVPLPQEPAMLYGLGNTIGDMLFGKDKSPEASVVQASQRAFRLLMGGLSPVNTPQQDIAGPGATTSAYLARMITPSIFLPIVELGSNKNTFGNEIVSGRDKSTAGGKPLYMVYGKNESAMAVNVAKGIHDIVGFDVAPAQLKYLATMFDPTASGFWRDMFGALSGTKQQTYPGQVLNPIARRFDTQASSFSDDQAYEIAKQAVMEARFFATNRDTLKTGARPTTEQARLAGMQQMFKTTDQQIDGIYRNFRQRPGNQDLLINQTKQQLQQKALKEYYKATGVVPRGG